MTSVMSGPKNMLYMEDVGVVTNGLTYNGKDTNGDKQELTI